jgi:iron complex transport system substrate-binding protein
MSLRIALLGLLLAGLTACDQPVVEDMRATGAAQRIISLAPNITELVYAAGAGNALVGVVEYSDFPPPARELPRVGDSFRIDYEIVGTLEPDLILGWTSGNPPEIIARLRELGFRVVTLDTTDLDSIATQLGRIGELAGTEQVATAAAEDFRNKLLDLAGKQVPADPPRVFWQISADPYFSVTGEHVIDEIIRLCGGRNIFADLPGLAPPITLEAILAEQPEVIIASAPDDAWQAGWQQWDELPAVRDGRLYSVHPDLVSRSGPRIVEGAAAVCAAVAANGS